MKLSYELSKERPKQLGLMVLQADETLECDMRKLLPETAELLVTRVASGTEVTSETLSAMKSRLSGSASLLPEAAQPEVIGYGCTSATAEIGAGAVRELIKAGKQTDHVTEPVSALIAACRAMDVKCLGLVSPYVATVSVKLREALLNAGIEVTGFGSFEEPLEANVVRIDPASVMQAARDVVDTCTCDAVFLSCTNLRTLDVIAPLEAELDLPVLSSNQVLAWHMCQLSGLSSAGSNTGRLWNCTVR